MAVKNREHRNVLHNILFISLNGNAAQPIMVGELGVRTYAEIDDITEIGFGGRRKRIKFEQAGASGHRGVKTILLSQSLITLDQLNPIQLIRINLSQSLITLIMLKMSENWKRELGQSTPYKHSYSEQKELLKRYYEIRDKNSKISDGEIAKKFKINDIWRILISGLARLNAYTGRQILLSVAVTYRLNLPSAKSRQGFSWFALPLN
uniref:Uncharacterized protein n=1 Tax=Globodera rostochiensis TaxID=31243 RepID=A0A914HQD1_GLORO